MENTFLLADLFGSSLGDLPGCLVQQVHYVAPVNGIKWALVFP